MAAKRRADEGSNGQTPSKRAAAERDIFLDIAKLAEDQFQTQTAKSQGLLAGKLIKLKGMVRAKAQQLQAQVKATDEAQQQLDAAHLNLQNILYEKLQVLNDIQRCHSFRPMSESMQLVDEATVLEADQSLKDKPHERMLARLAAERKSRESLCQQLEELEARQTAISTINNTKKKQLRSLPAAVKSVVEATEKAVGAAGLKSVASSSYIKEAKLLPEPLMVLLKTIMAYKEVTNDINVQVSVEGDASAVKSYLSAVDKERSAKDENVQELLKEQSTEREARTDAEDSPRRKGRSTVKASGPHPLALELLIDSAASDGTNEHHIKLRIEYFASYSLVAVNEVDTSLDANTDLQKAIKGNVLQDLYHGDGGDRLPRTSTAFEASLAGQTDVSQVLEGEAKPYIWLQLLCGLPVDVTDRQQHLALLKVISDIKQRLQQRATLIKAIHTLESGDIGPVLSQDRSIFPLKGYATFSKATLLDVHDADVTSPVSGTSALAAFKITLQRNRVGLVATCLISSGYPVVAPLFKLALVPGNSFTISQANLTAMTLEVNLHMKETMSNNKLPINQLLLYQLRELQMCLDLIVEAADRSSGSGSFKGQLFETPAVGPDQVLPFKWNPSLGMDGLFEHR